MKFSKNIFIYLIIIFSIVNISLISNYSLYNKVERKLAEEGTKTVNSNLSKTNSEKEKAKTDVNLNKNIRNKYSKVNKTRTGQSITNFRPMNDNFNSILFISSTGNISSVSLNDKKVDLKPFDDLSSGKMSAIELVTEIDSYIYIEVKHTTDVKDKGLFGHLTYITEDGSNIYFPTSSNWECSASSSTPDFKPAKVVNELNGNQLLSKLEFSSTVAIWNSTETKDAICRIKINYTNAIKGILHYFIDDKVNSIKVNGNEVSRETERNLSVKQLTIPQLSPQDEIEICGANGGTNTQVTLTNPAYMLANIYILMPDFTVNSYPTSPLWECNGSEPVIIGNNGYRNSWNNNSDKQYSFDPRIGQGAYLIWDKNLNATTCCKFKIPKTDQDFVANRKYNSVLKVSSDRYPISVKVDSVQIVNITSDYPKFYDKTIFIPLNISKGSRIQISAIKGPSNPTKFSATLTSLFTNASLFTTSFWTCNGMNAEEDSNVPLDVFGMDESAKIIKFNYNAKTDGQESSCEAEYNDRANLRTMLNLVAKDKVTSVTVGNGKEIPAYKWGDTKSTQRWYLFNSLPGDKIEICAKNDGTYNKDTNQGYMLASIRYYNINGEFKTINTNGNWKCKPKSSNTYLPAQVNQFNAGKNYFNTDNQSYFDQIDLEAFLIWNSDLTQNEVCCYVNLLNEMPDELVSKVVEPKVFFDDNLTGLVYAVVDSLISIKVNNKEINKNLFNNYKQKDVNAINIPSLKAGDKISIKAKKDPTEGNNSMIAAKVYYSDESDILNEPTDAHWECNGGYPTLFKNKLVVSNFLFEAQSLWVDSPSPVEEVECKVTLRNKQKINDPVPNPPVNLTSNAAQTKSDAPTTTTTLTTTTTTTTIPTTTTAPTTTTTAPPKV